MRISPIDVSKDCRTIGDPACRISFPGASYSKSAPRCDLKEGLEEVAGQRNTPGHAAVDLFTVSAMLTELANRSIAALATNEPAQELLRSAGIPDATVWAAFRLGAGGDSLVKDMDPALWTHCKTVGLRKQSVGFVLGGPGINIPTFDPRDSATVVGFIRLTPAQNKHHFATAPAGIACASDLASHPRVVLADSPLLALRLFQAGIRDVALVEDPIVLAPLHSWLSERQIIVVSHKRASLEVLRAALGPIAGAATPIQLQGDLGLSSDESLAVLGLTRVQLVPRAPTPPVDTRSLHHLLTYAQGRLATAEGLAALDVFGANQPELVSAYGIGFLPADFRDALDAPTKRMLTGLHIGNSLVIPAFDREGVAVDFLMKYAGEKANRSVGMFEEPLGMIAPVIATAFDEIIVTMSVWSLCRLWKRGHRNVLLFRSLADAQHNVERLRDAGVRLIQVYAVARERYADVARVLRDAGFRLDILGTPEVAEAVNEGARVDPGPEPHDPAEISPSLNMTNLPASIPFPDALIAPSDPPGSTEPVFATSPPDPGPPSATRSMSVPLLELVEHDEVSGLATFKAGTAVFVVEVPWDSSSRLEVSLRHSGHVHRDRFDVAVEAQRRRFASSAALRTAIAFELIEPHLIALLDAVRALIAVKEGRNQHSALAHLLPSDRDAAMEHLTASNLIERIRDDLSALGWIGEDEAKETLYLAATSRKLANPIWGSLVASSGAGKSHGLELIAELTPPEELVQISRLTDAALYYEDHGGLCHKLMVIDEADALTPEVIVALRVLKTRGALSLSQADRSGPSGQVRTKTIEARGPVAVLTSTAGKLDPQLMSRCIEVPVDESSAQTQQILAAQRKLHADPTWLTAGGRRESIISRHRTMQRLLACKPVVIPFAERIEFPATSVRHRREHERFLGLIEASALLHQHQRLKDRGSIVATEVDFTIAARLVARQLAAEHQGLGQHAMSLLDLLACNALTVVTMEDLARLRPEWNRYTFRTALTELMALDYVVSPGGGRGKRREYRLVVSGAVSASMPGVRLRAVGELTDVGDSGFANVNPKTSVG